MQSSTRHSKKQLSSRLLPLKITMIYLLGTYVLFAFGPISWPIDNWWTLNLYVGAVGVSFTATYRFSIHTQARGREFRSWRFVYILGGLSSIALLFPSSIIYAGRWPWQVFEAWGDQREAYSTLMDQTSLTEGHRVPIVLATVFASPFVKAAIPLGILHWKELSWLLRSLVLSTILTFLISSILLGRNRQTADIFILCSSAGLVALYRRSVAIRGKRRKPSYGKYWLFSIIAVCYLVFAMGSFVDRISQRMGGVRDLCMIESGICVDFRSPSIAMFDDDGKYVVGAAAMYMGQGYYGLSLALQKDFQPTWGLGHSAALMALYKSLTGDTSLYERTYLFRLRENNWCDLHYWSTTLVWFANDIGFFGVLFLMVPLSRIFALSWIDATDGQDDRAAVVFSILMIQLFFFTANSQLLLTIDGYFAVLSWLSLWLYQRAAPAPVIEAPAVETPASPVAASPADETPAADGSDRQANPGDRQHAERPGIPL